MTQEKQAGRSSEVGAEALAGPGINVVTLTGRLSQGPELRSLPSGDSLVAFRVVVPRPAKRPGAARGGGVDALDCAIWAGRHKRQALALPQGTEVRVSGALRRRFFRTGAGTGSRVEIEVSALQVLRRPVTRRAASA